jgi:hypothetical protein
MPTKSEQKFLEKEKVIGKTDESPVVKKKKRSREPNPLSMKKKKPVCAD